MNPRSRLGGRVKRIRLVLAMGFVAGVVVVLGIAGELGRVGGPGSAEVGSTDWGGLEQSALANPPAQPAGAIEVRLVRSSTGEGARVRARLRGRSAVGARVDLETTEDGQGLVRFVGVPVGEEYELSLRDPAGLVFWLGGGSVVANETRELGMVPTGSRCAVRGRVIDQIGRAVVGARIVIRRDADFEPGQYPRSWAGVWVLGVAQMCDPIGQTVSDAEGRFIVAGVPVGRYEVTAQAEGRWGMKRVTVKPADGAVDAALVAYAPDAVVRGSIREGGARSLEGACVLRFMSPDPWIDSEFLSNFEHAECAKDGTFVFPRWNASGAVYSVAVRSPEGPVAYWLRETAEGEAPEGLQLGSGCRVAIRAQDADTGAPIVGAVVMLSIGDLARKDSGTVACEWVGWSAETGIASFACEPCAIRRIALFAPGYERAEVLVRGPELHRANVAVDGDLGSRMALGEDRTIGLSVKRGVRLCGVVVDPGGAPIAAARVSVSAVYPASTAESGPDGTFVLDGVNREVSWLLIRKRGWFQADGERTISADPGKVGAETPNIRLVLRPLAEVRGSVRNEAGEGLEGVQIAVGAAGGLSWENVGLATISRADGKYVLRDIRPPRSAGGRLLVVARGAGLMGARSASFVLGEGEVREIPAIALARGGSIEGRVRDAAGNPAIGARVFWAQAPGYVDRGECLTGEGGEYSFQALERGTYRLQVDTSTALSRVEEVAITAGRPAIVANVVLDAELEAQGRVVDSKGRGIADARVTVAWPREYSLYGGRDRHVLADFEGRFRVTRLPPGMIRLRVAAAGFTTQEVVTESGSRELVVRLQE